MCSKMVFKGVIVVLCSILLCSVFGNQDHTYMSCNPGYCVLVSWESKLECVPCTYTYPTAPENLPLPRIEHQPYLEPTLGMKYPHHELIHITTESYYVFIKTGEEMSFKLSHFLFFYMLVYNF